ncbi:YheC/YheD family protein [Ammoniphilus sp. 3BR4]|uniref:YheC/YheD family protein n=1 Tax=Ammoniphilus sp. 3BR4 TaxID=3158265 RepID=UPI003465C91D
MNIFNVRVERLKKGPPLIGICISNAKPEFKNIVKRRLQLYPEDATLLIFRILDLNFGQLKSRGDCLEKKKGQIEQKQGFFPFPDVIFMQCHADRKIVNRIEKIIGRKIFNNLLFDKWECWNLLKVYNELCDHLPDSRKLENEIDMQQFLCDYEDVLLKPVNGHSGKGIVRVKLQKARNIEAIYLQNGEMISEEFDSFRDFWDWFSARLPNQSFIIQQSIQTVKLAEMATDVRLHMNKNHKGEWQVSTLLFRVATNDSHIAHTLKWVLGIDYLEKMFFEIDMERAIVDLGLKICKAFDKSGYHMADLGIDMGLDENGHPWIFEVNPLPFPHSLQNQYYAFTRPIEYANYLLSK